MSVVPQVGWETNQSREAQGTGVSVSVPFMSPVTRVGRTLEAQRYRGTRRVPPWKRDRKSPLPILDVQGLPEYTKEEG